jgi:methionyl-tRNA synthetase
MINRINADLANNLGNLAQRTLTQVQRNLAGRAPALGALAEADAVLLDAARALLPALRDALERFELHVVLSRIWAVLDDANRYVDLQAPWALRKTDPARMATVLAVLIEVLRIAGILIQPVMPRSAAALLDQLAVPAAARDFAAIGAGGVAEGTLLPPPQGVFPRIDKA